MKIVFFGIPAHGHVNPTLPVMRALADRGVTVLYYNFPAFADKISLSGVAFRPYEGDADFDAGNIPSTYTVFRVGQIVVEAAEQLVPFCQRVLETESPDLVLFDSLALWGRIAAETRGFPSMGVITTFAFGVSETTDPRDMFREIGGNLDTFLTYNRALNRLLRHYGVAGDPSSAFNSTGARNLVFTSRLFQPGGSAFGDDYAFVGPAIAPRPDAPPFPFDRLDPDRRKVYISLGTIHNTDADFFRACIRAFSDYDAQFILALGKTDARALGDIPPNFIVQSSVPQLELLPRVDAFITHGGMNSVSEALYHDVPLIIVPHQFEQASVARRVASLYAGIALGDHMPYGQVTPEELRAALDRLLGGSVYRQAAKRIGHSLRSAGGYQAAADAVLQAADQGLPPVPKVRENRLRFAYVPYPLWRRRHLPAFVRPIFRAIYDVHDDPPISLTTPEPATHDQPIRLPAQWDDLEAVSLVFPVRYKPLQAGHRAMIEAIRPVARVDVLIPHERYARLIPDADNVNVIVMPTDDIWIRDFGAFIGYTPDGQRAAVGAIFDPLPNYPQALDNALAGRYAAHLGVPFRKLDLRTEGGNVWSDGAGTLIMSEDIYDRNPVLSIDEVNARLHRAFAFERLICTPKLAYEETGHVDLLVKLASKDTVLVSAPSFPINRLRLVEAMHRLERAGYQVIELPSPPPYLNWFVYPVWRSYTNALTVNGRVLVPVFGAPTDGRALAIYRRAMPDHQVIAIDCRAAANGGGGVHCLTKEVPR